MEIASLEAGGQVLKTSKRVCKGGSITLHMIRKRQIIREAESQLPGVVGAPAPDAAPGLDGARVAISQGDSDCGHACRGIEGG